MGISQYIYTWILLRFSQWLFTTKFTEIHWCSGAGSAYEKNPAPTTQDKVDLYHTRSRLAFMASKTSEIN
jgi:hypothetical protein